MQRFCTPHLPLYIPNGTSADEPSILACSPNRRNLSLDACQAASAAAASTVVHQLTTIHQGLFAKQMHDYPILCGVSGPHHPPRFLHKADELLLEVQDFDANVNNAMILLFEL